MITTALLIYLYAFDIFSEAGAAYCFYRMWKMGISPDFTWSVALWAKLFQFVQTILMVFYAGAISEYISTQPTFDVLLFLSLTTLYSVMALVFAVNMLRGMREILPPHHG